MSNAINTLYEDDIYVNNDTYNNDKLNILENITDNINNNKKYNYKNDDIDFKNKIFVYIYYLNYKQYLIFLLIIINISLLIFILFYISNVINKAHEFTDYVSNINKTKIKDYILKIEHIINYSCDNLINCSSTLNI